ncbi:MAG: hypothetical protein JOZ08_07790 [Verrucomicrobia bacterium]|nr:hypothetical protein [Verrucomicrobiota bacterium]MBV8278129.1 hypothetical protein [Verrucomicrobiota bacterium]
MRRKIGMVSVRAPGKGRFEIIGEDLMNIARCLIAGAGVGLCLCAMAKAGDDRISNTGTATGPIVVKRVIVVRSHGDRVISVTPAYQIRSALSANRSWYSATTAQNHRRNLETSGSADNYNHSAKTVKTERSIGANQLEQQADKDNKSADRKPEPKQPEARQAEGNQDSGGLDRLTVQAQKEEEIRLAEPRGIVPR